MRENKFRAWDKDRKEMLYEGWTGKPQFFVNMGVWQIAPNANVLHTLDKKQNLEPMQHTGLRDKNGVEIYEGDILRCEPFGDTPLIAPVEYIPERCFYAFRWDSDLALGNIGKIEVIGNIYENPELLQNDV